MLSSTDNPGRALSAPLLSEEPRGDVGVLVGGVPGRVIHAGQFGKMDVIAGSLKGCEQVTGLLH